MKDDRESWRIADKPFTVVWKSNETNRQRKAHFKTLKTAEKRAYFEGGITDGYGSLENRDVQIFTNEVKV